MWDRRLQGMEAVVERQQGVLAEGKTIVASSSAGSTVESCAKAHLRHLAAVFWLSPY